MTIFTSNMLQITTKVLYGCRRGLDGRISEYLIESLPIMSTVLMGLEKWMIVLETLETEDMKALAIIQS